MNEDLKSEKRRSKYRAKNPLTEFVNKELALPITRKISWKYAEAICNARLIELGYDTFLPFISNSEIDMIACKDGKVHRVQIKAYSPKGKDVMYVDLTRNNSNERKCYTNIDWFLIYDGTNIYKFDSEEELHSINLRYRAPKNHQGDRIRMASDYIFG